MAISAFFHAVHILVLNRKLSWVLTPNSLSFAFRCFPDRRWKRGIGRGGRAGSAALRTQSRRRGSAKYTSIGNKNVSHFQLSQNFCA